MKLSATRRERRMPPGGLTHDGSADAWRYIATEKTRLGRELMCDEETTYAFRRPAMRKYDMRDGSDVVVPRVATKLMKAWSVGRHCGRETVSDET